MTFNIHHGEGLDGKVDLPRIAALIQQERADIVALQEVDKGVARTARRDLPAELAALTGLSCVFSNNFPYQGGEYGNAILTRFPIRSATNTHYRMLRPNEQRGLLQLTLQVRGRPLVVLNTHIDFRHDDSERLRNVSEIQSVAARAGSVPIILCGDFNDTPGSRVHQQLSGSFLDSWEQAGVGSGWTYPAEQPRKRIDYVWTARAVPLEIVSAHVPDSAASDHRPLVVEFRFRTKATKSASSHPASNPNFDPRTFRSGLPETARTSRPRPQLLISALGFSPAPGSPALEFSRPLTPNGSSRPDRPRR